MMLPSIVNYYVYTPFGKTLYDVENTENDFEFVGQFGVRKMGDDLTYMRNRFYMPSTGRFYSEDPIGLAGGDVGFYRYVGNDPVNFVDPWGLELSTGASFAIGVAATATTTALSFSPAAPIAPFVGAFIGGIGTKIAGGSTNQVLTNAAMGGLGGFGGLTLKGVNRSQQALGFMGDLMIDLVGAKADPIPFFDDDC